MLKSACLALLCVYFASRGISSCRVTMKTSAGQATEGGSFLVADTNAQYGGRALDYRIRLKITRQTYVMRI